MPLEYLPIMAQNSAPKPQRELASPSKTAWCPLKKPISESRVALLSSAALRLANQEPLVPREDLSYRRVASDPKAGEIIIDHHSGIGRVPKEDPEIVFPRTALAKLVDERIVGMLSPFHLSFMGGLRRHREIEDDLAPALAQERRSHRSRDRRPRHSHIGHRHRARYHEQRRAPARGFCRSSRRLHFRVASRPVTERNRSCQSVGGIAPLHAGR